MRKRTIDTTVLLSTLWIVVTVNYIFCDVFTLMYHAELRQILEGHMGGMDITQGFLLAFAVILEIPMVMILLTRLLADQANRWTNVGAGVVLTLVQAGSLLAGSNTMHYVFFSVVEIAITVAIVVIAIRWKPSRVAAAEGVA